VLASAKSYPSLSKYQRYGVDDIEYTPEDKKNKKIDMIIHAVNHSRALLKDLSKKDFVGMLEEHREINSILKELAEGLNYLLEKRRTDLLEPITKKHNKQIPKKLMEVKKNVVLQHEFEANERLIKFLTLELMRLGDTSATLEDPMAFHEVKKNAVELQQELKIVTEEVKELKRKQNRLSLQLEQSSISNLTRIT
jgi:hypothetical protein